MTTRLVKAKGSSNNRSIGKLRADSKGRSRGRETRRSDTISFNGPILLPRSMEQEEVQEFNTSYSISLTSNASGVVDAQYGTGLVTSVGDWANVAAAWHEYRVLGMKLHYTPYKTFVTTNAYPPMDAVDDRASGATLGSYASAANHESVTQHSSFSDIIRTIKMNGPEESDWTPMGTTFTWGYIKLYCSGTSNTQLMGQILLTFLVQVRGRA